ncbi:DNA oxidative demethylase ALKBH2 [Camellia lanceoleosa]|uniref:DNA oxidative demethylase ALKBH2 n=1 Tax=Camellia lanceoleosa TaxID=1840588 RepID=A0ACC0HSR8_9ERIC|nr:DNA oxidative demethylase ALKBH2 [Camellia lanceoleosa]
MERSTPVRKSHTSTADLLTWSEIPPSYSPSTASAARSHQPSDGISKVVFGGQVTDEEVESLNKRKPCSGYKLKEMTGSSIFAADAENEALESDVNPTPNNKTGLRMYQPAGGQSSDLFNEEPIIKTAKKIPNQKFAELNGNNIFKGDVPPTSAERSLSSAKLREMSGNNIFADGKVESRDYFGGVRKPPGGSSSIALV